MAGSFQKFGHYELKRRIARGGMAEIFLALERGLEGVDRRVVIKRILPQMAESEEFVTMFMDEARIAARLTHPNVATVHGLHEAQTPEGGVRFIAMEFVQGEDLAARMQRGPLELQQALQIARRIAQGLEAAHAALLQLKQGVAQRLAAAQSNPAPAQAAVGNP